MKLKLLNCLATGTLLIITYYVILIFSMSYSKSFHATHKRSTSYPEHMISLHFKVANNTETISKDMLPQPQKGINSTVTITEATTHPTTLVSNRLRLWTPYMMALHIAEQLTMSTSHFIEFMNLVHQWNLTGVEPVVFGSRMNSLRSMHAENIPGSVQYHQILNTSLIREKLSKCLAAGHKSNSSQVFVPLSVFLRQSMRTITLVYFSRHMNVLEKDLHAAADDELTKISKSHLSIIECTDILKDTGVSHKVEELLNNELVIDEANVDNFTVIQAFCIIKVNVSLVKIREEILTLIHHKESNTIDSSIVFISWQGKFTRTFTDMDTLYRCRLPSSQIKPSQQVLATSEQFLRYLGLKKQSYVAIHIRFEKLFEVAFKHQMGPRHFLNCCMLKLNAVLKKVKECNNLTSKRSTLLLHDYSPYGTDVCQHDGWKNRSVCVNETQYLLSLLNETKASEFDPLKFNALQNSGFVSLVEGVVLAGGHSLVVLGGGSFQVSITGRFTDRLKREHTKTGAVYSICTARDNLHNLEIGEIKECT